MAAFRSRSTAARTSFLNATQPGIIYGPPEATGKPKALVKYRSDIYTLAYYEGPKRVRQKFSDLGKARREANNAAIKIANGDIAALKLKGHDRTDYVRAMQRLREWKPDADLNVAIFDYVAAVRRLPDNTSLKSSDIFECFSRTRHYRSNTARDA